MILYDLPAGMHPRRVRILMAEKGISIDSREVDIVSKANLEPQFLGMNRLGKLPVLQLDDGSAISESLAICRYLDQRFPGPALFGATPEQSAHIDMWVLRMELELSRPVTDVFMHSSEFFKNRIKQVPAVADWARDKVMPTFDWLNDELSSREFIASDHYTMADIVAQCALVLGKAAQLRIGEQHAHLARWFANVTSRPSSRA